MDAGCEKGLQMFKIKMYWIGTEKMDLMQNDPAGSAVHELFPLQSNPADKPQTVPKFPHSNGTALNSLLKGAGG